MNWKIIFINLTLAFTISLVVVNAIELIQVNIMGGISNIKGFPIPYYYNDWRKIGIEFNMPSLKYLNIVIIFIVTSLIINRLKSKNNKSKNI